MFTPCKEFRYKTNKAKGFTLVELMITVVIAGILAAIALPSFQSFIRTQRVKTASFDLIASLTYARSEAIKRNGNSTNGYVSVIPASGGWSNGWTITFPTSSTGSTGTPYSSPSTLKNQSAYSAVCVTTGSNCNTPSTTIITFTANGRLTSTSNVVFTVDANPHQSTVTPRCIYISLSGRASSKLQTGGSC